jgi:hypothetical protein
MQYVACMWSVYQHACIMHMVPNQPRAKGCEWLWLATARGGGGRQ